jgi:hypothetical protein
MNARPDRLGLVAGFTSLLVLGLVSAEWTRAYVDHSRAQWEVATEAVRHGVPPEEIQLNLEWEGANFYLEAVDKLGARPPYHLETGYPWAPLLKQRYVIVAEGPGPKETIASGSYHPFFCRRPVRIGIFRPSGAAGGATPPSIGQ